MCLKRKMIAQVFSLGSILATLLLLMACAQPVQPATDSSTQSTASDVQTSEPQLVDRHQQIFDTSDDKGKLVARFLKLTTPDSVKAGDSIIMTFPDGKVMLIDGGAPACGPSVAEHLGDLGVTKIDAVVCSHFHTDHVGGLSTILENYEVGVVYRSSVEGDESAACKQFESVLTAHPQVIYLKQGDVFGFGGATIKVFNPPENTQYSGTTLEEQTEYINNQSLVMKITYQESSMLFGGDLYIDGEKYLLENYGKALQADIMKANHHGDETSNSKEYLAQVNPKICVMTHDGIASLDIYRRFRKNETETYITYVDGCVKVVADGTKDYIVMTQFDRQNDFLK